MIPAIVIRDRCASIGNRDGMDCNKRLPRPDRCVYLSALRNREFGESQ